MQDARQKLKIVRLRGAPRLLVIGATVAALLGLGFQTAAGEPPPPVSDAGEAPAGSLASPIGALEYTPGRGLRVGNSRVTIGGYSNLNVSRDEGGPALLQWDDLSFFVIADPTPRLHLFAELEFEDLVTVDEHGRGGTVNNVFLTERLYGDFTVSEQLKVRAGKFLTPVGRWNVIHAQPLVWTTSRPLATLLAFDTHTTGAMLFGSLFPDAGNVTYSLFGKFLTELDRERDESLRAERSGGMRLEYARHTGWGVGASYVAFTHRGEWLHLGGLDGLYRRGPLEVMGEFVVEDGPRDPEAQWGLYLQSVIEVRSGFYLVGRYEHFDQRDPQPEVNLFDAGVAFKPVPYVVLKAEYLFTDHVAEESPPGFKASVSVLF